MKKEEGPQDSAVKVGKEVRAARSESLSRISPEPQLDDTQKDDSYAKTMAISGCEVLSRVVAVWPGLSPGEQK